MGVKTKIMLCRRHLNMKHAHPQQKKAETSFCSSFWHQLLLDLHSRHHCASQHSSP